MSFGRAVTTTSSSDEASAGFSASSAGVSCCGAGAGVWAGAGAGVWAGLWAKAASEECWKGLDVERGRRRVSIFKYK